MTKLKDGYKETEIGVIPEEWEVKELNDITDLITKGTTPTTYGFEFVDDGVNFIKIESINDSYGILNEDTFSKITLECHEKLNRSILEKDDILFAIAGATVGKCAMINEKQLPANTNQALSIVRLKPQENKKFIFHQLRGCYIQKKISQLKTNTAQPNLNLKQIGEFKFPYPKCEAEQQRIAEILSTTDEHIEKLDKTIEDFQLLKKGMMKKLLTEGIGHTEFKDTEIGRIPKEWEVKQLSSIFKINTDSVKPFENSNIKYTHYSIPAFDSNKLPVIEIGETIRSSKYVVLPNSILVSKLNPRTLRVWNINDCRDNSICSTEFIIYKNIGNVYQDFYYYIFNSYYFGNKLLELEAGSTGSRKRVTPNDTLGITLMVPPINEQVQIASLFTELDNRINLYHQQRQDFTQLKKSLMEQLLTGKIRVNQ